MKQLLSILLVLLILSNGVKLKAQLHNTRIYSVEDGLAQATVYDIIQDRDGNIWMATDGGVSKYDGRSFKNYTTYEGLITNRTSKIMEDKRGNIWIGTNMGISTFHPKSSYKADSINIVSITTDDGLIGNSISAIFEDSKGNIWFGTTEGISKLSSNAPFLKTRDGSEFNSYLDNFTSKDGLANNTINDIIEDRAGNIWFATRNGISKLIQISSEIAGNRKKPLYMFENYTLENANAPQSVSKILEDKDGFLWIALYDRISKVIVNYSSNLLQELESLTLSTPEMLGNIWALLQDRKGNIWSSGGSALAIKFDGKNHERFSHLNGFARGVALSMCEDREGNIWMGNYGKGITQYKGKMFLTYTTLHGMRSDNVRAITEDIKGNIWFGTVAGIAKFHPIHTNPAYLTMHNPAKYQGFEIFMPGYFGASNSIWSMLSDSKGSVWIGTRDGLVKYTLPKTKGGKPVIKIYSQKDGLLAPPGAPVTSVMVLFEDSQQNLWAGTFGGLSKLNLNGSMSKFKSYTTDDGLTANSIKAICEDNKGNLWIGTSNGLSRCKVSSFENDSIIFENFTTDDGLPNNYILSIVEDNEGSLWFGTVHGISKYTYPSYIGPKGTFRNYSTRDGLSSDTPYLMIFDDNGYLYVGTNKGIDKFYIKASPIKKVKHFGKLEGFRGIETSHNAVYKDSNGNIWFGTVEGAIKYDPKLDISNKTEPLTHITKLQLFFEDFNWSGYSDTISYQTGLPLGLDLPHDQNHLTFQFIGISLTIPEKVKYQWKLEGFDKNWSPITQRKEATYSNLPHGEYTFIVKSCNNDGIWNKKPTIFSFNISPPWWQTLWFYLGFGFTGLGGIISYIKIRERNLKREKRLLEQKVKIRTQEISRQKKELEKLSIVASKTDNAVLIANAAGKLEWANEGFAKMMGYTLEEFKKEKGETMMEMSNNPEIKQVIDNCINKKSSVVYEVKNSTKDGNEIWVQTTLTPIIENGTLKKLVAIDTDITERKNAEEIIKQKNTDITDSINYAKQIQEAIFPDPEEIQTVLPHSFILFKPKAIVSGDFYWFSPPLIPSPPESEKRGIGETERRKKKQFTDSPIHIFTDSARSSGEGNLEGAGRGAIIIAAVDCTGHGVPGAFMSVIGHDLLNEVINNKGITDAAKILGALNDGIVNALKQKGKEGEARDGMDIALCLIDLHKKELQFSGAYNPLYLIRDKQLQKFKGNRFSIGMYKVGKDKEFTNHHIKIKNGDTYYIFSDGYADQFGGPEGKKFTYKRFQDLLIEIQHHSMEKQHEILDETFEKWKNKEEQLDDVLVIGIRI
ncbi:MAG: PAS domain S-box protein [Cytophagales bacterium]|nr:PAS domain S-box protein [Cytophagales bacterium]